MTLKFVLACSSFAAMANAHLFTTAESCIYFYLKKIRGAKKNPKLIRVCDEIRETKFFRSYIKKKTLTFREKKYGKRLIAAFCVKHELNTDRPYSFLNKSRGIHLEDTCRQIYSDSYGTVSDVHKKCDSQFDTFGIRGEIDGICDDKIIEIKVRTGKFCYQPPFHDLIQLCCYCYCLNKPGVLVEFDSRFQMRCTQITLAYAAEKIKFLLPSVERNVALFYKKLKN